MMNIEKTKITPRNYKTKIFAEYFNKLFKNSYEEHKG